MNFSDILFLICFGYFVEEEAENLSTKYTKEERKTGKIDALLVYSSTANCLSRKSCRLSLEN
jgi:hypothetical protein